MTAIKIIRRNLSGGYRLITGFVRHGILYAEKILLRIGGGDL
ncbi:MAG TPA: hypothetical protein VN372_03430 [Methanospirillum sp.]|nr:hypothetical protein [Methanospirillum sp.]